MKYILVYLNCLGDIVCRSAANVKFKFKILVKIDIVQVWFFVLFGFCLFVLFAGLLMVDTGQGGVNWLLENQFTNYYLFVFFLFSCLFVCVLFAFCLVFLFSSLFTFC